MWNYKVLICDDESHKADLIRSRLESEHFEIEHVASIAALRSRLSNGPPPDALFMDLVFLDPVTHRPTTVDATVMQGIRVRVGNLCKIFVYTQFTEHQIPLLRELAFTNIVNDWIDHDDLRQKKTKDQTLLRIHKALGFHKAAIDGVYILQLSDLHFGRQFDLAGGPVGPWLARLIDRQIGEGLTGAIGFGTPDIVTLCGDLTNSGSASQFEESRTFVQELSTLLANRKGSRVPIVLTNGNHDVNWDLSTAEEHEVIVGPGGPKLRPRTVKPAADPILASAKFEHFRAFFHAELSAADDSYAFGNALLFRLVGRLGFDFLTYNTSRFLTYLNRERVEVASEVLREIAAHGVASRDATVFVAHHPVSYWGGEQNQRELLELLRGELGVRVILSGHKHQARNRRHLLSAGREILEVQTGSLSVAGKAREENVPPNFRIVHLARQAPKGRDETRVTTWTFQYSDGTYKPATVGGGGEFSEVNVFS